MSADDWSLLPPPNGSSVAMQINARSEPFMATKSFHIPLPRPSMLGVSKNGQGGPLYDTAMIIIRESNNSRGAII